MFHPGLLTLLVAVSVTHLAAGQSTLPGRRVRLTLTAASAPYIGRVDSVTQGHVWLRSTDAPRPAIALSQVSLVEQSHGRKPALAKGLALGALGGAVVGGALWLAFINGDEYEEDLTKQIFAAVFLGSGAVGGALAGAGLSLVLARERWSVVPPERWAAAPASWHVGLRLWH